MIISSSTSSSSSRNRSNPSHPICLQLSFCVVFLTLLTVFIQPQVVRLSQSATQSNQLPIDFDEDGGDHDELRQAQSNINQDRSPVDPPLTAPMSVPSPTGWTAKILQRVTGWNDSTIAKIMGQITPRAPHPFVIPITDDNYQDVIQSELDSIKPGWGSDDQTVWVISVVATDRVSIIFEDTFDQLASNSSLAIHPPPPKQRDDQVTISQLKPDDPYLFNPNIRFGRIDYMGKTDVILTKWLIFKCPVMVVISNRGKELRFFKTGHSSPTSEVLGDFIRQGRWKLKPVWNSTFSPGNSKEWVLASLGQIFQTFHTLTDKAPGWLLMLVTSMLGSSLMQWLHTGQTKKSIKTKREKGSSSNLKKELADAAVKLVEATDSSKSKQSKVVPSQRTQGQQTPHQSEESNAALYTTRNQSSAHKRKTTRHNKT
ncbi:hypothetical protein O181_020802 [Austropuccinia psidii MF-1]|uniref:Uncharacterized protein n=1 Tax=Austropuccinia psidii MF-1 TaxID=1389203 RepID=A0A9Q3CCB5_9BASI|nr:hypothetical protein [Austropuccinia psidii MF-1]